MSANIRSYFFRIPLFWRLQLIGWGTVAVIGFCLRALFFGNPRAAFLLTFFQESFGMLLSCGLRAAYRRPRLVGYGLSVRAGAFAIVLSLFTGLINVAFMQLVMAAIGLSQARWSVAEGLAFRIIVYWLLFTAWSCLYLWLKSEFRTRAEQSRAANAAAALRSELQLLRSQLDPHFLFNSLNGISAEIPVHPETALAMLRELSDYLRFSLEHRDVAVVPLKAELDAMAGYLKIEQMRFGDRLRVRVDAERSVGQRSIPTFLLQPLVENAVKHAMHTSEGPWDLTIEAVAVDHGLCVRVRNTGVLDPSGGNGKGTGVGLPLLRRRLELLYPQRHRFSIAEKDGSVCAELNLEGEPCSA